jgi:hypothetical protein
MVGFTGYFSHSTIRAELMIPLIENVYEYNLCCISMRRRKKM